MNAQSGFKVPSLVTLAMLAGSTLLACGPAGSDAGESRGQFGGSDAEAASATSAASGGTSTANADAGFDDAGAPTSEGAIPGEIGPLGSLMPYGASGSDGPFLESGCAAPEGWKACMLEPGTPDGDGRMSLRGDSMSCTNSQTDFWMLQMACSLMGAYGAPCTSTLVDQVASYEGLVGSTLTSSDFQAISTDLSEIAPGPCLTTGGLSVPGSELIAIIPSIGTIVAGNPSKKKVYSWVFSTSLSKARALRKDFVAADYSSFVLELTFPVYVVFSAPSTS